MRLNSQPRRKGECLTLFLLFLVVCVLIGGWIGGVIVFVICSGLATVWGVHMPMYDKHHGHSM